MEWGRLPEEVVSEIRQKEWNNQRRLRARLLGERAMPIKVALKPPSGQKALGNLPRFQHYVEAWRHWSFNELITWHTRNYHQIGTQEIPVSLTIPSLQKLFEVLGTEAIKRSQYWDSLVRQFSAVDTRLAYPVIKNFNHLEALPTKDIASLIKLLPQLQKGMGKDLYLRALPVKGVDTKFIENNKTLIGDMLEAIHPNEQIASGLHQWLGCIEKPKGWLIIRPLCPNIQRQMMGLEVMKLDSNTLRNTTIPARNILIVENEESGFSLPQLNDTVAVIGGGRNTAWMAADWLSDKQIGYWGDIDSWGLTFLSNARTHQPHLKPIMMDLTTYHRFVDHTSHEETSNRSLPECLSSEEIRLFNCLLSADTNSNRLEQERLPQDYIHHHFQVWLDSY